jgi:toxin ParE1/3/4
MNVVLTQRATNDLLSIQQYIGQHNPERAESFVEELLDRCYGLANTNMATAFPLVPRYERYGIRRRSHGNYLIFYQISGDRVEVIHVLHGARDYLPLLFPEGE